MLEQLTQLNAVESYLIPWAIRIVSALAIFIIGRWIAKGLTGLIKRLMRKGSLDETLVKFVSNIAFALLMVVVVLAALEQLGVKTTSALAILGAAGLAVGLSLQSSLSNFASGIMLIVFRPFRAGDFVEAGGVSGIVEEISIFNTVMRTGDNREVTIPNGQIYSGTIVNYSARDTRRIDLVFGIGYDDNIGKAKQIIDNVMNSDDRILSEPEPVVMVLELGASSVDIAARPWVKTGDYWAVRADVLEKVKSAFDDAGISIPYPQQDVHIKDAPQSLKASM